MHPQTVSSMNCSSYGSDYFYVSYVEAEKVYRPVNIVLLQRGPHVTESDLARQVLEEFLRLRNGLDGNCFTVSVSSVRLQNLMMRRYPDEYRRLVLCGSWKGKWHRFLGVVGLRCFLYEPEDYRAVPSLEAHVPANELRCCLTDEDHWSVRRADGMLGEALRATLLDRHYLQMRCQALAMALRDSQVERSKPRWWTPRAPWLTALLEELAKPHTDEKDSALSATLRRAAATELSTMLVEDETLARHISTRLLRTMVARCISSWDKETFVPVVKCIFTMASG